MSRAPPFPTARRPQTPNGNQYDDGPSSPNTTRPLNINRTPTRPTTPSGRNVPFPGPSSPTPGVPIRPTRSGLRTRQVSEYSNSDRQSMDSSRYGNYRDSVATTRSDASGPPPRPPRAHLPNSPSNGHVETNGLLSPISPSSEQELSPGEAAALAMFQNAIARRRGMTEEDRLDAEYEREKEREAAVQRDRQRRMKEKAYGRKTTKPRAGDIDGQ